MHNPDPLRSIPFHRRYQTHNGNGVPLGITTNGPDGPVTSFRDLLSGSNGELTQSDGTKRPSPFTQSGVPFLRFNGSDDFLTETFTLAQPAAVILAYRHHTMGSPGSHDIILEAGPDGDLACNLFEDGRPLTGITAGPGSLTLADRTLADGVFSIVTAIYNDAQSSIRLNGLAIAQGGTSPLALAGLTLGSALAARSAGIDVIACLIPVHLADVSACEQYLATLLP